MTVKTVGPATGGLRAMARFRNAGAVVLVRHDDRLVGLTVGTLPSPSPRPSPNEEREQARRLVLNRALLSSRAELKVKTPRINYAPQRTPSPRWERAGVRGKGPITLSIA